MKPVCGLLDPRGSLTSSIPAQAIAEANKEVQKATWSVAGGKRGPYKRYSSTLHSKLASMPVSMVQHEEADKWVRLMWSWKESTHTGTTKTDDGEEIAVLPVKKHGRKVFSVRISNTKYRYTRRTLEREDELSRPGTQWQQLEAFRSSTIAPCWRNSVVQ